MRSVSQRNKKVKEEKLTEPKRPKAIRHINIPLRGELEEEERKEQKDYLKK